MAYTRGATYNRNIFLLADNWCFTQGGFQAGRKGGGESVFLQSRHNHYLRVVLIYLVIKCIFSSKAVF